MESSALQRRRRSARESNSSVEYGERAIDRRGEGVGVLISEDIALAVGSLVDTGSTDDGVGGRPLHSRKSTFCCELFCTRDEE